MKCAPFFAYPRSFLAALVATTIGSLAQTNVSSASKPPNDEPIEMSPFVVSTDQDRGYVATSSLAGTRIKSDLKDIGAAIQIVTKDLMDDLAATDYSDLLLFTTSTETAGLGGNFSGADFPSGGRVDSDSVMIEPSGANRVRGLGAPDRTRDYFLTAIPFDNYNSDRVDISRGANSILFGLGSPSGVINQSLIQANLNRSADEVRFQVSSGGANPSNRTSIDFNRVLAKGRMALRLAALSDNRTFDQQPAFRNQRRIYATIAFRPWAHTMIRAGFESGKIVANNPDALAPIENLSNYIAQLRAYQAKAKANGLSNTDLPLYADPFNTYIKNTIDYQGPNAVVAGFTNPMNRNGTNLFKNIALVYADKNSPAAAFGFQTAVDITDVINKANYLAASSYALPAAYKIPAAFGTANTVGVRNIGEDTPNWSIQGLTDLSLYDFAHHLLAGTAGRQTNVFGSGSASIERTFFTNRAGIELSYDQQSTHTANSMPFRGATGSIRLDLNRTLPTGGSNVNFGRPYVVDRLGINDTRTTSNSFRATGFVGLDFQKDVFGSGFLGRILGSHTMTGLFGNNRSTARKTMIQEAWNSGGNGAIDDILDSIIGVKSFQRQVAYLDYIGPPVDLRTNPAGLTMGSFVIDPDPIVRQQIPAPGGVVPVSMWSSFSPNKETYNLTRAPYVRSGSLTSIRVESLAAVLQSRWFDDSIVTTVGLRRDTQDYRQNNSPPVDPADPRGQNFTTAASYFNLDGIESKVNVGRTKSYGAVFRLPRRWRELPFGSEASLFTSRSDNVQPDPGRLNQFLQVLAPPKGETREVGINLSVWHGKLNVRINHYQSEASSLSSGRLGSLMNTTLIESTMREIQFAFDDLRGADPAAATSGNYTKVPQMVNQIAGLFGAKIDVPSKQITLDESHPYAKVWKSTNASLVIDPATGGIQSFYYVNPPNLADTQDSTSKGYEAEITYNPTTRWRLLMNVSRQTTINSNSLPNMTRLIADFGPVMYGTLDKPSFAGSFVRGTPTQTSLPGNVTNALNWQNVVLKPYYAIKSLDGTPNPEQRRWRCNFVTNYSFGSAMLKGFSVGANLRWQDKVAIGYPLVVDSFGNFVPDRAHSYYGPSETEVGFRAGYQRRILQNRCAWSISLNVQNAFSKSDDLIPVLAQPDGSIAQVRTAAPTAWILTNSLKF